MHTLSKQIDYSQVRMELNTLYYVLGSLNRNIKLNISLIKIIRRHLGQLNAFDDYFDSVGNCLHGLHLNTVQTITNSCGINQTTIKKQNN